MRAKVSWVEGLRFEGEGDSGHGVTMESKSGEAPPHGPSPMEMVLLALGGCSSVDVVDILRKMRQALTSLEVAITAERAPEPPRVFTKAYLEFIASGEGLTEAALKRAVDLSMDKYCSVAAMLGRGGTKITYSCRVQTKEPAEPPLEPVKPPSPTDLHAHGGHVQPSPNLPFPGPPGPLPRGKKA